MGDILEVSDDSFDSEIINSDIPAMVDFWAAWCGPCRAIAPIVEELADSYAGRMKVAKMDVDTHQEIAMRYKIISIPNVLFFRSGEVVDQIIGAVGKKDIEEKLSNLLQTT